MTKKKDTIWQTIQVICWFIFAGLCVQSGALIFNFIYSFFKPVATHNLHLGLNLSQIYTLNKVLYVQLFGFAIFISILKATVFYFVLQLFKKIKLVQPFTVLIADIITKITYYALSVGFLSYIAHHFTKRLLHKGYDVNVIERYWDDSSAYLMMSAILFVISLIFKKGIELQHENDLTV